MKQTLHRLLIVVLGLLGTAAMEVTTQTPVVQVVECVRDNAPPHLTIGDLRIEARGEQVTTPQLSARFYSHRDRDGLRAMLHITAPSDLAGMRYLLVEQSGDDALHLYLPALGKVRRVNSAGPDGRIAGTTLDVSDLRLISQLLGASSISRDRATRWHDRAAQVLRFSPTVADSPYRRVLATVDEQTCVVVRAEFQDAQDTVKTYQVEPASLRQAGRYWYASRGRMHDHRLGSHIDLSLGAVRVDRKPPSRSFDPAHFHKVD